MENEAKNILINARNLLADESNWIKGWFALDADNNAVVLWGNDAVCWCMTGAIHRASGYYGFYPTPLTAESLKIAFNILGTVIPNDKSVSTFNDSPTTTHAMVLEAFDKAIATL